MLADAEQAEGAADYKLSWNSATIVLDGSIHFLNTLKKYFWMTSPSAQYLSVYILSFFFWSLEICVIID